MEKSRRVMVLALINLAILLVSLASLIVALYIRDDIKKWERVIEPENIGVIWRSKIEAKIESLTHQALFFTLLGLTLLILGTTSFLASVTSKKWSFGAVCLSLFMLMPTPGTYATVDVSTATYYQPRLEIPTSVELSPGVTRLYDGAEMTTTVKAQGVYSHNGFVAFLLAVACSATYEFLEIGWYHDYYGQMRLYSASIVNGIYECLTLESIYPGRVLHFKVNIFGYTANVWCNDVLYNTKTFTATADGYSVQGESNHPYNRMNSDITETKVWYWYYNPNNISGGEIEGWEHRSSYFPIAYTSVYDDDPYNIEPVTASPYIQGAHLEGGNAPSSSPHRGGGTPPKAM